MRKALIILAAIIAASCAKQATEPTLVPVTFGIGGVTTGTLTKGDVTALIADSAPEGEVEIKLTSTTNPKRTYRIVVGQPASVAIDTYTATATYRPASVMQLWRGYCSLEPSFSVNTAISVTEGTSEYTLPATYDCIAIVWDKATTARYTFWSAEGKPATCPSWVESDDKALVYATCTSAWTKSSGLLLTAYPVDDVDYEPTQYIVTTSDETGAIRGVPGRWYSFAPGAVQTSSGSLAFDLPDWVCGN